MKKSSAWALAASAGIMCLASVTSACVDPPPQPPCVKIEQINATSYTVWLINYTTFGAGPGMFCSCAFNRLGPITGISLVEIYLTGRTTESQGPPCDSASVPGSAGRVPAWSFTPNAATGPAYQSLAGSGNWSGFFSATTQAVAPGQIVDIRVVVTVAPGTTPNGLRTALDVGNNPFIGTDGANPDGTPNGAHLGILPTGDIIFLGLLCPAIGPIGVAGLGTACGLAGLFVLGRRRLTN